MKDAKDVVTSYLAAVGRHDPTAALAHLRNDFRLEFVGGPSMGKDGLEQAMGWDRGTSGSIEWEVVAASAGRVTIAGEETNEFLSLLGARPIRFEADFDVDDEGLIRRQRYEVVGSGPSMDALLDPVVSWARTHAPEELAAVYPDGRLVYTAAMGRRWVRLLRAWRGSTGGA